MSTGVDSTAVVDLGGNRVMLHRAMRCSPVGVLLLLAAACSTIEEAPLSYGRCDPDDSTCGLNTRCDHVTASTTGADAVVCTLPCATNADCPGLEGACVTGVATADDAGVAGRCLRSCNVDADCRPGTVCRAGVGSSNVPMVCVANLTM